LRVRGHVEADLQVWLAVVVDIERVRDMGGQGRRRRPRELNERFHAREEAVWTHWLVHIDVVPTSGQAVTDRSPTEHWVDLDACGSHSACEQAEKDEGGEDSSGHGECGRSVAEC
jgi:hypothetical protein